MKFSLPVLFALLLCLLAAGYSGAATLTVTKIEDTNDGVCDGDCSLREAVVAAVSGDTVVFSPLFNTPQTITLTLGQIPIDKNLTITGTGRDLVDVSGNLAGRIFLISANLNVTMSGLKLRDGKVGANAQDTNGGAIRVLFGSGNLALSNMEFTNNIAFYEPGNSGLGSAVFCSGGTMTLDNLNVHHHQRGAIYGFNQMATVNIRDSILSDNGVGITAYTLNMQNTTVTRNTSAGISAQHITLMNSRITNNAGRGVIGGDAAGTTNIENSIISQNRDSGVAIAGFAVIRNTVISSNLYNGSGAGIINGGTMYIINSAIIGNSAARHGGGIATYGHLFLTNSTVSGNIANGGMFEEGLGGGIYAEVDSSSHLTLTNSTISNNRSSGKGGGVRQDDSETTTIRNTIIAGNTSNLTNEEDVSGTFLSQGNNLIGDTTGGTGWNVSDLLNVNPFLAPLGYNGASTFTHALLLNSPAINAGNSLFAVDPQTMLPLTTDQRGAARFIGGKNQTVDIGAYEAFYSPSPVTVSGRITTYSGRGIDRSRIMLDGGNGNIRYAQTNPFGYYRFNNLIPGTTYTITVTHKFYLFTSPQFFTADQNRDDLNFIIGL